MKLRIRLEKTTTILAIDKDEENMTVKRLKSFVVQKLALDEGSQFYLSLNGKDILDSNDSETLTSLELVSGDMLYIIMSDTTEEIPINTTAEAKTRPQLLDRHVTTQCKGQDDNQSASKEQSFQYPAYIPSGQVHNPPPGGVDHSTSMEQDLSEDIDYIPDALVNKYLNEPMLCRDSNGNRVPHILEALYQDVGVKCPSDAIMVVLHVLMMEVGFTLNQKTTKDDTNVGTSTSADVCKMPVGWRSKGGVYKIAYSLTQFPDIDCSLMCTRLGNNTFVVHGLISGENGCDKTLNIRCPDYIQDITANPSKVYTNLSKLSRLFKNAVASPLVSCVKEALNVDDPDGFLGMMFEIKMSILSFLDVTSLLHMSEVSKEMNTICNDNWLWRHLYLTDFGRRGNQDLHQDWKMIYRETYRKKKEHRRRMRHMAFVVPPYVGRPHPPFPFTPIYPPGAIGGDYDLNPTFPGMPSHHGNPLLLPRPRFDPFNPLPDADILPGRGRGPRDNRTNPFGGMFGPRFF